MRARPRFWGYFVLAIVLLLLISLPRSWIYRARVATAELFFPLWEALAQGKRVLDPRMTALEEKIQQLRIENQLLQEALQKQQILFSEARRLNIAFEKAPLSSSHQETYLQRLSQQLKALPAQVIFRSPATWHSALWINVGSQDNQRFSLPIVSKNSPVIVNGAVIGIVDQVGLRQSRVRLITDSGLTPSVRAVRGNFQDMLLLQELILFMERLKGATSLAQQEEVRHQIIQHLNQVQELLQPLRRETSWFLAKGELHGSSSPLWRFRGTQLYGEGFNFDFTDETGTARDLRSGAPVGDPLGEKLSLIKVRDLLVTTGMDGIFPAGFPVAEVTKVEPLKEGDFCYSLEARSVVDHLNELSLVFVLPPIGYDGAAISAKNGEDL